MQFGYRASDQRLMTKDEANALYSKSTFLFVPLVRPTRTVCRPRSWDRYPQLFGRKSIDGQRDPPQCIVVRHMGSPLVDWGSLHQTV